MKKLLIFIAICVVVLPSCGAKKNVATGDQEPAASTLEQRIAAGEFAWLDTIHMDTTSSAWVKKYSGNYILSHKNMLHGQKMYGDSILIDSLVLTPNGYYYKYSKDSLADFGRFSVRKVTHFKVCVEQYKVDLVKGEQTDEIERIETEIYNQGEFLTDWYSFTRDFHCFWTVRRYNTNSHRWELEIVMDVQNECIRYLLPGNNTIKWEKKL